MKSLDRERDRRRRVELLIILKGAIIAIAIYAAIVAGMIAAVFSHG